MSRRCRKCHNSSRNRLLVQPTRKDFNTLCVLHNAAGACESTCNDSCENLFPLGARKRHMAALRATARRGVGDPGGLFCRKPTWLDRLHTRWAGRPPEVLVSSGSRQKAPAPAEEGEGGDGSETRAAFSLDLSLSRSCSFVCCSERHVCGPSAAASGILLCLVHVILSECLEAAHHKHTAAHRDVISKLRW